MLTKRKLCISITFCLILNLVCTFIWSDMTFANLSNVVVNAPPTVNAGVDQIVNKSTVVNLNGVVTDDSLPTGSNLSISWSKISGPGTVTFGNSNVQVTTAAFSMAGRYTLRLNATDSILSSSDDVVISVTDGSRNGPGGIFITGHDPDYHASQNDLGSQHMIQRAVEYVTFNKQNPKLLLVTDLRNPNGDQRDPRLGMTASGYTYDVADYGSNTQGVYNLNTVNFSNYDAIVVSSDYGGWLRQDELNILNSRSNEIINYINGGGGLVAFNESGMRAVIDQTVYPGTSQNRYDFIPFPVTEDPVNQNPFSDGLTAAGLALGLTKADMTVNSHSAYTTTGNMDVIDVDSSKRPLSLAIRGKNLNTSGAENEPPSVNAGSDQILNISGTVNLNGTIKDDGLPIGSSLTVSWKKVSGVGDVTFNNSNSAVTTASFTKAGTYVLRLNASDSGLSSSDDIVVTVYNTPGIPKNLITDPKSASITVTWDAVSDATGYDIEVDGTVIDNGVNITYIHSNLVSNSKHNYRVRAKNPAGVGSWTSMISEMTLVPNTWLTKQNMPTARSNATAAAVNGSIYVIGGINSTGSLKTIEQYNPSTNIWDAKANMPTARQGAGAAVVNGKIYVIGGKSGSSVSNVVEEYDPTSNIWTTKKFMPTARFGLSAVALNGKIYAIGGYTDARYLDTVEVYDPITNTWTTKTSMSIKRTALGTDVIKGKIYAVGGYNGTYLNNVEEYDPLTDKWTTRANMLTPRRGAGTVAVNGKLLVPGGYNGTDLDVLEEYDATTNTWTVKKNMSTARGWVGAAVLNDKIYVAGGSSKEKYLNTYEMYVP